MIISDFRIKCVDCLHRDCPPHHYEPATCDYEFGVKLDERPFSEISNERIELDHDEGMQDPESNGLLVAAIILAGSSFVVLIVVVICVCMHAIREGSADNPIDDLDYCPNCAAAGGDCDCCLACENACAEGCLSGCAEGCCHVFTSTCLEACFSGFGEACCTCTGHMVSGIATSSFR